MKKIIRRKGAVTDYSIRVHLPHWCWSCGAELGHIHKKEGDKGFCDAHCHERYHGMEQHGQLELLFPEPIKRHAC